MKKEIGILMLDTKFNRIIGDIGNDETFPFPTRKKYIKGATADLVVKKGDMSLLKPFIEASKELEREGVCAITTSCGFLAKFQRELSDSVYIPLFTSSLLQIRNIYPLLKKNQTVGVLTIRKSSLTKEHFEGVSCSDVPIVVYGMEGTLFEKVFMGEDVEYDKEILEKEIQSTALKMLAENPNIGAIVCECTNMPPFTKSIVDNTDIPIFDINTLVNYIYSSIVR